MMKLGKLLVSVGAGAILGLLVAPKKGSELREDLKAKSSELYGKVKNMTLDDVETALDESIDNLKKSIDEFDADTFKADTKDKLSDLEDKVKALADKVKESDEYNDIKESAAAVSAKVNELVDRFLSKVEDDTLTEEDLEDLEEEIEAVEEEIDELIEDDEHDD